MVEPITPQEAAESKQTSIPPEVIECFNAAIAAKFNPRSNQACFTQEYVLQKITGLTDISEREMFDNHWLDVEPLYERAGWKVAYDKPGFNEPGEATFTFKRGRTGKYWHTSRT